jgi:hypothetical protein
LVLTIACMWGRRNVANLYRYLDGERHRTRFNNFFLVERWDPEAALRQQAQAMLRALRPTQGETIYLDNCSGGHCCEIQETSGCRPLK